ncbi:MAG TPA: glucan biosynthesis glucosyltransferase H, partial [Citreicella sp.]|nr:glucan biosynthesis glucosyltransferase H [Citreicella sp.]
MIFSLLAAGTATVLLLEVALQDGSDLWDYVRAVLILVTTAWLAWGAGLALSGLAPQRRTS